MSTPKPVTKFKNLSQHMRFSEKIKADIDETGKDVLQKIKDMDQETSNNLLGILLNDTIKSIFSLACDLQDIVIKSNEEDLSHSNLKTAVKKLSQDCNQLIQEYETDSSTLKEKFQLFIQNLLRETEGLFNTIQKDDLHAHKHELVEVLKEILCTLHRMQMRIHVQNFSAHQLVQIIEDIKRQYADDVCAIGNNWESLKQLEVHFRHTAKHVFDLGCHLNKVASNYDGEVQHKILNAASLLIIAVAEWLPNTNDIDNGNVQAWLNSGCNKLWAPLEVLLHYIENQLENKKSSKNLKDVIALVVSYGLVNNNQMGSSINHDLSM